MRTIPIEYKLYLLTCLILIMILCQVLIPFFNPYLGAYAWWLCLANVLLMLMYNGWRYDEDYRLKNQYGWRNMNLIIGLVVTCVTILLISIGDSERVFYELPESMETIWKRREIFWDLWVLLLVNGAILYEKPILRF